MMTRALLMLLLLAGTAVGQTNSVREGNSIRFRYAPFTDLDNATQVATTGMSIDLWLDIPPTSTNGQVTHLLATPRHYTGADLSTDASCQTLASCKNTSACKCLIGTIPWTAMQLAPAAGNRTAVMTVQWCWTDSNGAPQCDMRSDDILIVRRRVDVMPTPSPTP